MNKNVVLIGGVAIVVILGVLLYYGLGYANPTLSNATSTPGTVTDTTTSATTDNSANTNTDQANSSDQSQTAEAPFVVTDAKVFPTDTTAEISGAVTPNGALTNYWYEYGTTGSLGSRTANQLVGSGYIPIPAPAYISGLTKDTTYFFRLVAQNQFGKITGSQYTFQTSHGVPAPVGTAPLTKTLAASGVSRMTVNLNGEVTPNKAATQYWFEYGKTSDLGKTTAFVSVGDGSTKLAASVSLSNLDPATTYYYRLNAQNQFGTINGSILTFKTSGPADAVVPVVTTQVASAVTNTKATLNGTVNPYGTQTSYWFEYSADPAYVPSSLKTTSQKSAGAGTKTVTVQTNVTGLASKTTYYVRVVAQSSAGTVRGASETFTTN